MSDEIDDNELLRDYVERGSDEAFRCLVERHSGMVHGAARRMVHQEHVAQDVTQAVFIILARKAASMGPGIILAGWLYRTTRFVALEALRAEKRRLQHHDDFVKMNESSQSSSVWEQIAPALDEVMSRLGALDRDAVVLRFLREQSFAEVARALGISEAAAKMRVGRALTKLRAAFARSGVVVPTGALLAALSSHAASAAPAGLAKSVATVALTPDKAAHSLSLVNGALKLVAWNKIKSNLATAAVVLLLIPTAIVIQKQVRAPASSAMTPIANFDPMVGEWQGTYESRVEGMPNPLLQTVTLSIRTTQAGRSCEINMQVSDTAGRPTAAYRFTHTLDGAGNGIRTVDDPQIGRMAGEGVITESANDRNAGEWRVAFRTPDINRAGFTECRWVRKGDELIISRVDAMTGLPGANHLYTDLKLRRVLRPKAAP